jgi:hypothetical protein
MPDGVARPFSKSYIYVFRIAPFLVYVEIEVGLPSTTHWDDTNRVMLLLKIHDTLFLGMFQQL